MLNAEITGKNQMLPFSFKRSQPSRRRQYRFPLLEKDFDIALGHSNKNEKMQRRTRIPTHLGYVHTYASTKINLSGSQKASVIMPGEKATTLCAVKNPHC